MSDLLEQLLNRMKEEVASTVRQTMISVLQDEKGHDYPERVTVTQASEITGYRKNSLYQMHSQGKVPGAHKVGSKLSLIQPRYENGWQKEEDRFNPLPFFHLLS